MDCANSLRNAIAAIRTEIRSEFRYAIQGLWRQNKFSRVAENRRFFGGGVAWIARTACETREPPTRTEIRSEFRYAIQALWRQNKSSRVAENRRFFGRGVAWTARTACETREPPTRTEIRSEFRYRI